MERKIRRSERIVGVGGEGQERARVREVDERGKGEYDRGEAPR